MNNQETKKIYLAGGCFWGIQAYFSKIDGIVDTKAGYANGHTKNPSYEDVLTGSTGHAETVVIEYHPKAIPTENILYRFFDIIDPTTINKQALDIGSQYRSGIYYVDKEDEAIINKVIDDVSTRYAHPVVTEVKPLEIFYTAEDYHQHYLDKNPNSYCHVDLSRVKKFRRPDDFVASKNLSELQYNVTQNNATEPPFSSPYNDNFEEGIYVDIVSGEALFSSKDKFDSGSGWPSFRAPIEKYFVKERNDDSFGMTRIEIRSAHADSHLGHLFREPGGNRYCINGAALKFIPLEDLEKEGLGEFLHLFK